MTDSPGRFYISYSLGSQVRIEISTVTSFSETFSKAGSTTPLVSLSVDNAITIESGSTKKYSLTYSRRSPYPWNDGSSDSSQWSNSYWLSVMTNAVDRWQARTDGFTFEYAPTSANPYITARSENVYVKSFTAKYSESSNEVLTGSLELDVGTMYVSNNRRERTSEAISRDDFQVNLSNRSRTSWYMLMGSADGTSTGCLNSYTLYGGLEQPFEYAVLRISRKRLSKMYAGFENDDIQAGMNAVYIHAVGSCTQMTVTKCKLSDDVFTITAYADSERLRGYSTSVPGEMSPYEWITTILTTGRYGVSYSLGTSLIMALQVTNAETGSIWFPENTNAWYIVQVCAMVLGARVFFAQDKAYVVDYRSTGTPAQTHGPSGSWYKDCGDLDLHPASAPASGTGSLYGIVTGNPSLGDEGTDTIINKQTLKCSDTFGAAQTNTECTATDEESVAMYWGEREGTPLNIPYLVENDSLSQAAPFAQNLVSYRSEPQQSVEFSVKEMNSNGSNPFWQAEFPVSARATSIVDDVEEIKVSNASAISGRGTVPQKLLMTQFVREYPKCITTYTWGVMSNIDLSTSTSQILSNQR